MRQEQGAIFQKGALENNEELLEFKKNDSRNNNSSVRVGR